MTLTEDLLLQMNVDYGTEEGTGIGGSDAKWYGVAGIARYTINQWFFMNVRAEVFKDPDGVRTGTEPIGGLNLWEFTLTPEFKIRDNMVVRFEFRHDSANKDVFDKKAGLSDTQNTVAVNALIYF